MQYEEDFDIKDRPLIRCPKCGRFLIGGKYYDLPLKSAIEKHIRYNSSISGVNKIEIEDYEPKQEGYKLPKKISALFLIRNDKGKELEGEITLKAQNEQCKECSKRSSNYFEATLQLKSENEDLIKRTEKILADNRVGIKTKKKSKGGYDFQLTSNKGMLKAIRKLSEEYPAITTTSRKLHTKDNQTGKELFRVTALYVPITFSKGDIIEYLGKKWIYQGYNRNRFKLRSLTEHPREKIVGSAEYKNFEKAETFKTQVVSTRPILKILDENYQDVSTINISEMQNSKLKEGIEVSAVQSDGRYFIVGI